MQFNYWDLGQQPRGAIVEVVLSGNAANVRLLDQSNYQAFKSGRSHRLAGGGHVTSSPARLQIPHAGRWFVTIDYGGYAGRGRASVRVLPGLLPALRERPLPSLGPIGDNLASMAHTDGVSRDKAWDVFVSHATEDKEEVVRPLAHALTALGLTVWYDEFELAIGDSLRRKIDQGVARSTFGVVVLSEAFFRKNWSQYELDGLVSREMAGPQVILPLWHKITKAEILLQSPSLADKLARSTSDLTLEEIADEIAAVVARAKREAA